MSLSAPFFIHSSLHFFTLGLTANLSLVVFERVFQGLSRFQLEFSVWTGPKSFLSLLCHPGKQAKGPLPHADLRTPNGFSLKF